MKKWLGLFIFVIPLSMMLNVHQSKLYLQTKAHISYLQHKQNQLLEENQKIIAEIARSSAPATIEQMLHTADAELSKVRPDQVLRIIVPEEDRNP